ncbi:peroxisome membrane protein [Spinellus fusiger]|nr:peroxisome membrane protein [Spinellus fusiger]
MNLLATYEAFLIKNASQITSIESSLRSLTYFLPGRFQDAEFASQALYAALHLMGLHHNSILRKAVLENKQQVMESEFNKYLLSWSTHTLHKRVSWLLSVLQYTQVLIEMAVTKQWGKRAQWRCIALVESLKAVLRLVILHGTGGRMNLSPYHLQRHVDPATLSSLPNSGQTAQRTQKKQSPVPLSSMDVTDYLMSKVLTPDKLRKPQDRVVPLQAWAKVGEVLSILRPLVYVLAILRFGRRAWSPWVLSLVVEVLSLALAKKHLLPLEKDEMAKRHHAVGYNLLRGAFYANITRPRLERLCASLEKRTLLSIPGSVLRDYLPLWESIYFYTSSS